MRAAWHGGGPQDVLDGGQCAAGGSDNSIVNIDVQTRVVSL